MKSPDLNEALRIARAAAARAAEIAMGYFGGELAVETKDDDSPVTEADRACERAIRETIAETFPDHAFYGEEYGREGDSPCLWLIDPIDGTKSFIRGLPFWSVQVALSVDGELVAGVSRAPVLGEEAWAAKGLGARLNDQPLGVSDCREPAKADISGGNLASLAAGGGWDRLGKLIRTARRFRAYGDYYHYHRLAAGQIDAVVESDVNILDIAALAVIVREAGGKLTDLAGGDPDLETTSVLAAPPQLHGHLLEWFGSSQA